VSLIRIPSVQCSNGSVAGMSSMAFNFSSFETRGNYKCGFFMEKRRLENTKKNYLKVFSNLL